MINSYLHRHFKIHDLQEAAPRFPMRNASKRKLAIEEEALGKRRRKFENLAPRIQTEIIKVVNFFFPNGIINIYDIILALLNTIHIYPGQILRFHGF